MDRLKDTLKPGEVNASDYDAIYFTGSHGTMWDSPDNAELQELSREIYEKVALYPACATGYTWLQPC
ncbi:hypothetical protein P9222_03910 [Paenibacillus amylolyticus]|nr:hypothetical protein [Paenibacillus amylolyticus]WFR63488.1 hypothetical protein P9222_03910 [Paenibacillus amylolyticus]